MAEAAASEHPCCAICLVDLSEGATYALECGHAFHRACVANWLQYKHECPICKTRVSAVLDVPDFTTTRHAPQYTEAGSPHNWRPIDHLEHQMYTQFADPRSPRGSLRRDRSAPNYLTNPNLTSLMDRQLSQQIVTRSARSSPSNSSQEVEIARDVFRQMGFNL